MQIQNSSIRDFVEICNHIEHSFGEKISFTDNIRVDIQKASTILQGVITNPIGANAIERRLNKQLALDFQATVLRIEKLMQDAHLAKDEKAKAPIVASVQVQEPIAALVAATARLALHRPIKYRDVAAKEQINCSALQRASAAEAYQRAKDLLIQNKADIKACGRLSEYGCGEPRYPKPMFLIVTELLTLLATYHISNEQAYSDKNNASIFDNIFENLERSIDEQAIFNTFLNACIDSMYATLKRVIADNLADALIWGGNKLNYPVTNSYRNHPPGFYDLIRLFASKTKHSSISQLFAAVFMDDVARLDTCLKELNMQVPALMTQANKAGIKYTLFEIGIAQNSLKCVARLLAINPKLSRTRAQSWQLVQSPGMGTLLVQAGIAPDPHIFAQCLLPREADACIADPLPCAGTWYKNPDRWLAFVVDITKRFPELLSAADSTGKTVIEALYFGATRFAAHEKFFNAVVKQALPLSSKITQDMQARCLTHKERKWLEFLPADRRLECAALMDSKDPISSSRMRLEELRLSMELQLKVYNLDPESIDGDLIVRAHSEKKRVKKQLMTLADSKEKDALKVTYDTFVQLYDHVVDRQPIFQQVRQFSRMLRKVKGASLTSAATKFLSLWVDGASLISNSAHLTPDGWRQVSLSVRTKIATAAATLVDLPKRKRWLQIVHGTNSAALPTILQLGRLMASGKLFKAGIAPLTGEGSESAVTGNNLTGISTAPPHTHWEQCALLAATPLLYSEQFAQNASFYFLATKEYDKITGACQLLLTQDSFDHQANQPAFWFELKRGIMRLKMTENTQFMQKTKKLREDLNKRMAQCPAPFENGLKECLQAWDAQPVVALDTKSWMFTNQAPLVFGSSEFAVNKLSDADDEVVVTADLKLGEDLDLIFTSAEAVEKVTKEVGKWHIRAFPLECARFLEMRQMTLGSVAREQFIKDNSISTLAFHRDILPYYATPFPKQPFCKQNKKVVALGHPPSFSYDEYIKAFQKGSAVARSTHGPMHASRAALFGIMLKNILVSKGLKLEVPLQMMIATVGLHDAARQDDGIDRWDNESAEIARHYVRDYIFNTKKDLIPSKALLALLDLVEHSIREKDARQYTTALQLIVSDADRFDVVRTMTKPKEEFDAGQVAIMTLPQCKDFPIGQLMDEVIAFVGTTENPALKLHLEHHSQDYLRDLALIFCTLDKKFPLMKKYLQADIGALTGTASLDPKTLALVSR